jgi:hypothetical protein
LQKKDEYLMSKPSQKTKKKRRGGSSLQNLTEQDKIAALHQAVHRAATLAHVSSRLHTPLSHRRNLQEIWDKTLRMEHTDEMTAAHINAVAMGLIYCAVDTYIRLGFQGSDPEIDTLLEQSEFIDELRDFRDALFHPYTHRDKRLLEGLGREKGEMAGILIAKLARFCVGRTTPYLPPG